MYVFKEKKVHRGPLLIIGILILLLLVGASSLFVIQATAPRALALSLQMPDGPNPPVIHTPTPTHPASKPKQDTNGTIHTDQVAITFHNVVIGLLQRRSSTACPGWFWGRIIDLQRKDRTLSVWIATVDPNSNPSSSNGRL